MADLGATANGHLDLDTETVPLSKFIKQTDEATAVSRPTNIDEFYSEREHHEARAPRRPGERASEEGGGQQRDREHRVESGQDPGDAEDGGVELREDVGQRQRDDRRVREDDADRERPGELGQTPAARARREVQSRSSTERTLSSSV